MLTNFSSRFLKHMASFPLNINKGATKTPRRICLNQSAEDLGRCAEG
uniref:Uncharacterized protein n=1 Tax=Nelumbo nucifera TaxID=4432 RepID=A0A822ZJC2_NELNU|nr:TPA_asm: hypothetical protein HUJ06_002870 [Nelumbo nucifera]